MTRIQLRASRLAIAAATGSLLWCAAPALAQEAPAATEAASPDVVVTARKTNERIQDVPLSITAISGDALRDRGASDIKDILRNVPGLANSGFERGLSRYSIRGLSTGASSPTVGIYLDDISLVTISTTFSGGFDPVFFDMQRIEVLKGPQGTLYGGSAMGGAIKYVSATPDLNRFIAHVAAGAATTEYGGPSYNGEVVLNVPLVEGKLAARGGFYYKRDGGYIDVAPGLVQTSLVSSTPSPTYTPFQQDALSARRVDNANFGDTYVGRFSLEWRPDDSWVIRPQAFYQDWQQPDTGQFFINQPGLSASPRILQPTHDVAGIYSLNVEKQLGGVRLTALTSYWNRSFTYGRDYSFYVGGLVPFLYPLTSTNSSVSKTRTFAQEVRLASNAGPASRLKWVIGAYYSNQNDRLVQTVDTPGVAAVFGTDELYYGNTFTNAKQYALFGEATLTITDGLDLTAGARLFEIDQTLNVVGDGPLNGGPTTIARTSKESGLNPKLGLSYRVTHDNLLYASVAKGFRPGGPNRYNISPTLCAADFAALGITGAPSTYNSDNLWTYEVGSKNLFGGNRVTLNAAAYLTKWKKIQQQIGLPTCGFGYNTNVGSAEIKGFEVEGRVEVLRGLDVGGNASYTDGRVTEAAPGTSAKVGDQVESVPDWTATAYLGYALPLSRGWQLNLRGEYQYQGKARYDYSTTLPVTFSNGIVGTVPNPGQFRKSFDVVNVFASFSHGDTKVRLYANNLFNARPLLDLDVITRSDKASTLRPRTIGIEVSQGF